MPDLKRIIPNENDGSDTIIRLTNHNYGIDVIKTYYPLGIENTRHIKDVTLQYDCTFTDADRAQDAYDRLIGESE